MSVLDVKTLATENLPKADFPAPKHSDFRVFLTDAVHQGIWRHASENLSVEICGVLVGGWSSDADGPYASITQYIRCDGATQKFAEVTFTHDSWAQINKEMDSKYQDLRIIGWYHSHPNFGIFLSDRDGFIQQNFFSGPGQIAMVVDPVRKIEGIFVWRNNKTSPLAHFWVGDKIRIGAGTGTQDESMSHAAAGESAPAAAAAAASAGGSRGDMLGSWTSVLVGIILFLGGWLWATQLSSWQRLKMEEGAVAHYGLWKGYKPGFEELLQQIIGSQEKVRADVTAMIRAEPPTDEKLIAAHKQRWADLIDTMRLQQLATAEVLIRYGLQEHEKRAMLQLLRDKLSREEKAIAAGTPIGTPPPAASPEVPPSFTAPAPAPTTPAAPPAPPAPATTPPAAPPVAPPTTAPATPTPTPPAATPPAAASPTATPAPK